MTPEERAKNALYVELLEEALTFDPSRLVENGFPVANLPLLTEYPRAELKRVKKLLKGVE